ncbi:MAG: hypothetical protein GEU28_02400 [Dehalococcoidia bacterium]|nr:hypothetical protein [Dehalococcoidia bacterium]
MTVVAPIPAGLKQWAAALILLAALLPQVLYIDHHFPFAETAHSHAGAAAEHTAGAEDDSDHSLHCHGSLGSCSNVPMTAGPGQLLSSAQLLVHPVMAELGLDAIANEKAPAQAIAAPLERPPQESLLFTS